MYFRSETLPVNENGEFFWVVVPSPSAPSVLSPQQYVVLLLRAQEYLEPETIWVNPELSPVTFTGVKAFEVPPLPNDPKKP